MTADKGARVAYLHGVPGWPCTGTVESVDDTGFGITLANVRRDTTPDVVVIDAVDVDELLPAGATEAELFDRVRSNF
jgi:hypothetical protein